MPSFDAALEERIRRILVSHGATRAHVFGSYAKGTATDASDLDLIVELPRHLDLLDVIRIEHQLSDELGIKVEIASESSLSPYIRDEVLRTRRPIPLHS